AHLLPQVPAMDYADHDPHAQRILDANDFRAFDIGEDDIRRSRRAYFANLSYLDDKLGQILNTLEATRQEATILFVSDHGDMLGERGLWFKMCFYDGAARVPLMVAAPDMPPGRVAEPVSTLDVTATLCDLAGVSMDEIAPWTEGESLVPVSKGARRTAPVAMEYAAEGSQAPLVALREGPWKYTRCDLDPEQLFDLGADPMEQVNRAADPSAAAVLSRMRALADARWDLAQFDAQVRESQARRWIVYEALRNGAYFPWDHQPLQKASERYMRNHMVSHSESPVSPRG
ncbi:MAG: sulfatase-like hydrolase/transferase, partial [Pseudomonadota bacterium]